MKTIARLLSSLEPPSFWELCYYYGSRSKGRPRTLDFGDAVAACERVDALRNSENSGLKWDVAIEDVAKHFEVSVDTIQRLLHERNLYQNVKLESLATLRADA